MQFNPKLFVSTLSCLATLSFGTSSKATTSVSSNIDPQPISALTTPSIDSLIVKLQPPKFKDRKRGTKIDAVIIHSMCAPEFIDSLNIRNCLITLKRERVGPHYIIDRDGIIYQYADESKRAPHAGISKMPFSNDKRRHVSEFSIGIEVISGRGVGYTDAQYASLSLLIGDIGRRHELRAVIGHKDIAIPSGRRWDPDVLFDWQKLKVGLANLLPNFAELQFPDKIPAKKASRRR